MRANGIQEKILSRINASDGGAVFVASDFHDLGTNDAIRKSLSRLEKTGLIRRVLQGVYEYPEYSHFLQEFVATSPHRIALALARNNAWTIVQNGDIALNQLGLSPQVPAEWTYASDGPSRRYILGKTTIHLKRTTGRDIANMSYKFALIVQAIKAIGKHRLDNAKMHKLSSLMTDEEKSAILNETKYITNWVYEVIKEICNGRFVA